MNNYTELFPWFFWPFLAIASLFALRIFFIFAIQSRRSRDHLSYTFSRLVDSDTQHSEKRDQTNKQTLHRLPALHIAVINNNNELVSQLLQADADVNIRNINNETPLHCAAEKGFTSIAVKLIQYGANINSRGRHGETPLHLAASKGHLKIVELLIKNGADPELLDDAGWSAENCAESAHHNRVFKLIHRKSFGKAPP
jgi:ankyrin repeat protein